MNMNREYRKELKTLRLQLKASHGAIRMVHRDYTKTLANALRDRNRQIFALDKQCGRINKRIAILEGRLS